jgi:hypothetical protein
LVDPAVAHIAAHDVPVANGPWTHHSVYRGLVVSGFRAVLVGLWRPDEEAGVHGLGLILLGLGRGVVSPGVWCGVTILHQTHVDVRYLVLVYLGAFDLRVGADLASGS